MIGIELFSVESSLRFHISLIACDFGAKNPFSFQPGSPNLEYLGTGYNAFEGNPRGSDIL